MTQIDDQVSWILYENSTKNSLYVVAFLRLSSSREKSWDSSELRVDLRVENMSILVVITKRKREVARGHLK